MFDLILSLSLSFCSSLEVKSEEWPRQWPESLTKNDVGCRNMMFILPFHCGALDFALMFHTLCSYHALCSSSEGISSVLQIPNFFRFPVCYKLVNAGIPSFSKWLKLLWALVLSSDLFPDELPLAWRCGCLTGSCLLFPSALTICQLFVDISISLFRPSLVSF